MSVQDDLWFDATKCFIGGTWVAPLGGEYLSLENPSDGSEIAKIARGKLGDVDAAVQAAKNALTGEWGRMTALERGRRYCQIKLVRPPLPLQSFYRLGNSLYLIGFRQTSTIETSPRSTQKL